MDCNNFINGTILVPFSDFSMPGRDVVLAGQSTDWGGNDGHMFFGSMAGVGLFNEPLTANQIQCLNHYDAERVGVCAPLDGDWSVPFLGSSYRNVLQRRVQLHGDASMDARFGLQLDGEGDFATMPGIGFTDVGFRRGSFTISLWFLSVNICDSDTVDRFEYLFSSSESADMRQSGVHLMIACTGDDMAPAISTAAGDVLRAYVRDQRGNTATLDYSLSHSLTGGAVTGNWVHVALAVTKTSLQFYIDGELSPRDALGYPLRFNGNWDGTTSSNRNVALPDLGRSFDVSPCVFPFFYDGVMYNECTDVDSSQGYKWCGTSPLVTQDEAGHWSGWGLCELGGFDFEETYVDFTDYNYTAVLNSGENHTFHAMDTGSDGWHGGFWEIVPLDPPAALSSGPGVAGGRVEGQVTSFDTYTDFTVPNVQVTPCFFPFVYRGETYNECTDVDFPGTSSGMLWCATTPEVSQNSDGSWSPWGTCVSDDDVPLVAYGPGCRDEDQYNDFNMYTQQIQLKAGVEYYMHAGVAATRTDSSALSWGDSAWKIINQPDEAVIAGGPDAGCCEGNAARYGQQATAFSVNADTTALLVLTTAARARDIIWAINKSPADLAEWEWRSTLDTGGQCGTPMMVRIATHQYAPEISWEIDGGTDDARGRQTRISGGQWHRARGPKRADMYLGARVGARPSDSPSSWTFFTGSLAGLRIFPRALEDDEANCLFRDGQKTVQTCKAPDEMPGLNMYVSMLDGELPANVALVGDTILDGAWGAVVDGEGDAVQVSDIDYSSDSTFTLAFWFTKTQCEVPGRYERIFAQSMEDGNWFTNTNNTNIHILFACSEYAEDGLSTLWGDIIRVLTIDDDGQRGTFDISLNSAKSGGVVEDAWVHFAMSVTPTSVVVYIDGRKLDSRSDRMHDSEHMRDLLGPSTLLGDGSGEDLTHERAKEQCGDFCRSQGYSYFGLQWTNQCFCDNSAGSFGEASETATDGYGACDVDNDGIPDCGYGQDGYPASWYEDPRHNAAQNTDERGNVRKACGWRNAVYQISEGSSADAEYQGCFLDGQPLTRCASATTCEMCALMASPTALNPDGCGWSGRGDGGCYDGYTTSPGECAVSEYGFPADRRGGPSESEWWAWAQNETNVFWPDPTSLRQEATLGGFTMDEVYSANTDNLIELNLEPGFHIFQGAAEQGVGWFGGYYEITVDGATVAGGPAAGRVNGPSVFGVFTTTAESTSVVLNIHAGDLPSAISWKIDPAPDGSGSAAYSGPREGVITLGEARNERKGYEGSFAGLAILRRPLDDDEASCLYREGAGVLAVCEASELIASERRTVFYGSFVDGEDLPAAVQLGGDAYLDRDFGIQLDGDEDYFSINDRQWYSYSDVFAISFWFSKQSECSGASDSNYQTLFSHQQAPSGTRPWEDGNSNINIQIGCAADGIGSTVQSAGAGGRTDILRFWLQDDSNNKAVFDVGLDSARGGGYVTDQWIHLALSVSRTRIEVFLDGLPAQRYGFPTSWSDAGEDWAFSTNNMAWNSAYSRTAAAGHNPFACLEGGNPDGDCCAGAGSGSCTVGHTWSQGAVCYSNDDPGRGWVGEAYSSNCVPDGSGPPYQPPSRDGVTGVDQYGSQRNTAYSGLPKNPRLGRFSNSGIYASNQEYTVDIALTVGDHTFTPHDSRGQNWAGGTWWITEKVDEDVGVCGGGVRCDGQGDGPCDCDPCPACNGPEIARGGIEEDLMQDVPQTFTVPAPDYLVAAFGPGCGRQDSYQDFNVYRHMVTLQAGTYFFHSGGRLWDSANVDPSLPMDASYWEVFNNATGDIVAGGPGDGAQRSDEGAEGIQVLTIPSTGDYEVVIHTFQTSGIAWAITSDFNVLGDDIRRCDPTVYTLHVRTGASRPWAISWEIDGGENPNGRNDLYSGPHRRPIYMGGLPTRDAGGRVRRDEYFEGSIAQVVLLSAPLDPGEADCLFRSGEGNLGVCPTIEEMRGGRDWFGTFLGDSTNRIASRDLSGSRQAMSESWDEERTLQDAIAMCAEICSQQGYAYMGLQWANECWCDNDYGSKGSAAEATDGEATTCSASGSDAAADVACGTGRDGVCGWRNAVYSLSETGVAYDGETPLPGTPAAPTYVGCFADQITPRGTTLFGDAIEDQEENFGVRLDGEGDYLTIDPMSQCQDRRRGQCTENYAADGEFTISFWFWKRACATPGTWEYLFSHQNNSAGIYNEPAPECTDGQISTDAAPCSTWAEISTVINSEEERQAWIRSDPELHGADGSILDQECMECMPNWWRQYRGNYTSQLPWLVPALDLDPVEIDGSMYQVGYPMSLCLDNAGHRDMDVHRTVESFLNFKCTDPEFGDLSSPACNWKTWRRGAQAMPEDQRMRTLFKLGNEIRSEADQSVSGYTTIQLSNDLIPNANINMFLGCSDHGESSSVSGDFCVRCWWTMNRTAQLSTGALTLRARVALLLTVGCI